MLTLCSLELDKADQEKPRSMLYLTFSDCSLQKSEGEKRKEVTIHI